MVKYFISLIFSLILGNAYGAALDPATLPVIVKNFIQQNKKECEELKDTENNPGRYHIADAIVKTSTTNRSIEYLIYSSEKAKCSASASFDQGNGGPHLIIFSNLKGKWQKIFDDKALDYKILSSTKDNIPNNLLIYSKGTPGFTVEETEYEWDIQKNSYFKKKVKEDIYNLKKHK